jgi:hypothetical protein
MDTETAADDIIDAIAQIEMNRQESAKMAGLTTACNEALRKLREMLVHEQEAAQRHGEGTRHPANAGALTAAIDKVKNLAGVEGKGARAPHGQKRIRPSRAPYQPPRNRGRRTMGQRGDR